MKSVYISYFYQMRFFKENMIPFSTALYWPSWLKRRDIHRDKNNILWGLQAEDFVPQIQENGVCSGVKECRIKDPDICNFMKNYREQIFSLNAEEQYNKIFSVAEQYNNTGKETIPVLIVYESSDNKCSEREVIRDFFESNGIKCEELKYPISENYK